MPTYEYECPKCKKRFDAFQKMTDELLKKCPSCGAKPRRLIGGGTGIIFKGSGFYATDYRSKSYKKKESEDMPAVPKCKPGADCSKCDKA